MVAGWMGKTDDFTKDGAWQLVTAPVVEKTTDKWALQAAQARADSWVWTRTLPAARLVVMVLIMSP
jgi:hypothetical protein